jgi:cyclopropane fatty-acyl-phospholipid synthase-like methyltransferase
LDFQQFQTPGILDRDARAAAFLELDLERARAAAPSVSRAWASLPHPLRLIERASPTRHYHFGLFEREDEALEAALDRMALLGSEYFRPRASLLEVGCGMGGTAALLAARGNRVLGLDPCAQRVAYARACSGTNDARFVVGDLLGFAGAAGTRATFDGISSIETLQHFPVLAEFFDACRALLAPQGVLVLKDVARAPHIPWEVAGFHARDALVDAGRAAGFALVRRVELGEKIRPTLPRLAGRLEAERALLMAEGGSEERDVERELDELLGHMAALANAFDDGSLLYEHTILRRT